MLLRLDDLKSGTYKNLENKKVNGFYYKYTKKPLLDEFGSEIVDDNGCKLYETIKTKEYVEFEDTLMFIEGDGTFEHKYLDANGEENIVNYTNDAFLVKYSKGDSVDYYVSFNRPRVKNGTIICGTSIDNYIASRECEEWDTFKQIKVANSRFNTNINLSSDEFSSMDEFISSEKDINLTYIVGNKFEVYYDGSDVDSTDYSTEDYNDWFIKVMPNEHGVYTKDGDFIMGYLLTDFMKNRDSIESDVDNIDNRLSIY